MNTELVDCRQCVFGQEESTFTNGVWAKNGKLYCYCEGSTANGSKFDQLCPKGPIVCSMFTKYLKTRILITPLLLYTRKQTN